jgi:hypothetical protein
MDRPLRPLTGGKPVNGTSLEKQGLPTLRK